MREYLIFKSDMCGEVYLDAYRIDDKPVNWIASLQVYLDEFAYI